MKKTSLILSFLSFVSIASTEKSFIEVKTDTDTTLNKHFIYQDTDTNENLKVEQVIDNSGFTFGLNLQHRGQISVFPHILEPTGILEELEEHLDFLDSNIYTKFKKNNFNASLKLNHKLKFTTELDYQNYNLKNLEYGLHSKISVPFLKKNGEYHPIYATIKGFVQKDFGKFKDVRLDIETQNQPARITSPLGFQYIRGTASTRYTGIKDWILYAEGNINYQLFDSRPIWTEIESVHGNCGHDHSHENKNTTEKENDIFSHFHGFRTGSSEPYERGVEKKFLQQHKFSQNYTIAAKYKGFKDLEISGKIKGYHGINPDATSTLKNFAFINNLNIKYTGIKNLIINNDITSLLAIDQANNKSRNYSFEIKDTLNAKYKYNISDKLSIIPEGQITTMIRKSGNNCIYVTPKITINYKPTNNFTIEAAIKEQTSFTMLDFKKIYVDGNKIYTNLSLKYTW